MTDYFLSFLIWTLAVFGTAFIIVFSAAVKPVRDYFKDTKVIGKLLTCVLCVSWWIGAFYSLIYWSPSELMILRPQGFPHNLVNIITDAFIGSASTWLIWLNIEPKMRGK
jgi:hypothetical protein